MSEEIHVHVPKGAKVIIHEDEPEVEREATLDDVLKELRELRKLEAQRDGVMFVPYPVYPPPQPIWVVPPQPYISPFTPIVGTPYRIITTSGTLSVDDSRTFAVNQVSQ